MNIFRTTVWAVVAMSAIIVAVGCAGAGSEIKGPGGGAAAVTLGGASGDFNGSVTGFAPTVCEFNHIAAGSFYAVECRQEGFASTRGFAISVPDSITVGATIPFDMSSTASYYEGMNHWKATSGMITVLELDATHMKVKYETAGFGVFPGIDGNNAKGTFVANGELNFKNP